MKKITLVITLTAMVMLCINASYAGKIKNLNINASGNSKVEIKTTNKSTIENVQVKKDPESKVIINDKDINCEDDEQEKGICKPY